ncbi:MAG: DNA-processing protein DprA [Candidatus Eisenbacteria bacterium]
MGKGRSHEIVLSLVISGLISSRRIVGFLRTTPPDVIADATVESLVGRFGLRPQDVTVLTGSLDEATRLCARLHENGVGVNLLCDTGYPNLLREISMPPPVLFTRGDLDGVGSNTVAVVGSRKASLAGVTMAASLARDLAGLGFVIVSGLARGIDTAAHKGALEAGGRTVAVLGSGIDDVYPPENIALAGRISGSGAVISELPPDAPPLRQNFPRRNRIISGLCLGTVVVEAGEKSGALITAGRALEQNRSVFAVPSTPGFSRSKGANKLLREGATLVESASDIVEELRPQLEYPRSACPDLFTPPDLTPDEEKVIGLLSDAPAHVDEISRSLDLESRQTLSLLLVLETRGLVRSMPGKFYVREAQL